MYKLLKKLPFKLDMHPKSLTEQLPSSSVAHTPKLDSPIIGKYIASTVVGAPATIMDVSPAYAIPALLRRSKVDRTRLISMRSTRRSKEVGLDLAKVNLKSVF